VPKFLTKFALFDKRKEKWKPKAIETVLAKLHRISYKQLQLYKAEKALFLNDEKIVKCDIFGKIFDEICTF